MKPKRSSPHEDELGKIDFTPKVKSKEAIVGIIEDCDKDVKKGVEAAFTLFGLAMQRGLPGLAQLQREAREGRDG